MTGSTTLTVPFPTNATSLSGPLPGLSAGAVTVQVFFFNDTATTEIYTLSLHDALPIWPCALCVTDITPSSIDLASAPGSFSIAGQGFASGGVGAPVWTLVTSRIRMPPAAGNEMTGSTTLTVPLPTNATSLSGPLPGLSAGAVTVQVFFFNDTATTEIYTLSLHDALPIWPCALCVTDITPSSIDLASAPGSFSVAGQGFAS